MRAHIVRRAVALLALSLAASSGLSACSDDAGSAATPGSPAVTPATASSPAGTVATRSAGYDGTVTSGAALRFSLPASPRFILDVDRVRSQDGTHTRRWRHAVAPAGPFCMIETVEQPQFSQPFPQTAIAMWNATLEAGDTPVRNEVMTDVPHGATSGVDQEITSSVQLAGGTRVAARIRSRSLITPGETVITLITSGPIASFETCHLNAVFDTFEPTGQEAPVDPPVPPTPPPPTPSGSPSRSAGRTPSAVAG